MTWRGWLGGTVLASWVAACGLNPQPEPPDGSATTSGEGPGVPSAGNSAAGGTSAGGRAGSAGAMWSAGAGGSSTGTGGSANVAGAAGAGAGAMGGGSGAAGSSAAGAGGSAGSAAGAGGAAGGVGGGAAGAGGGAAGAGGSAGGDAGAGGSAAGAGGDAGAAGVAGQAGAGAGQGGAGGQAGQAGGPQAGQGGQAGAGGSETTYVAFAHLSDALGEIEVCAQLGGTGPIVEVLPSLTAGAVTKLAPLAVTARWTTLAGDHSIQVFAAGSACAGSPLVGPTPVSLQPGTSTTLVIAGQPSDALGVRVVALADATVADPASAKARFFHAAVAAAPLGPVDVFLTPSGGSAPVGAFTGVGLWQAATQPSAQLDARGYATLPPGAYVVSAGVAGSPPSVSTAPSALPATAGTIATLYGVGASSLSVLACVEAPGPLFATCGSLPLQ